VFTRPQQQRESDGPPSVHELFTATMRDDMSLRDFEEALLALHGIRMSHAAMRLMSSTDGTIGRLNFQQFARALQDGTDLSVGAGRPMIIRDKASAIISDNCGVAEPAHHQQLSSARPSTDICQDPFIKEQIRLERAAAKGPFPGNPVRQTNHVSPGNPFVQEVRQSTAYAAGSQACDSREMASTATRMFVGGELSSADYEGFLMRSGLQLASDSELHRLISAHDKVGDGNFAQFMRVVNRELAAMETLTP
jgi:hypothetical protein